MRRVSFILASLVLSVAPAGAKDSYAVSKQSPGLVKNLMKFILGGTFGENDATYYSPASPEYRSDKAETATTRKPSGPAVQRNTPTAPQKAKDSV